ncbi:DNA-binding transcriptional response regulator, NtrC family, contains REC, AAA-type ATPase, and a Fis-type DNA-binding domains [Allopseudospirillum japonicum]|uniref:DNA-binding transcriptional response regulator, NtrC family, contains REC, AAA-type ATPase, and a Fis-type DNA-binding domains n=1 Tax=Allopseudospirillum japonicum TaxID=64971 RepID=A0A1H6SM67_9GAMM|nr:sigma-54 dependent transcriptional regulator [Allopseudospirillum japonicum]SEI68999.1 DNA-binding transcriptional response regulator, NtrC family, contains REC, AAA-type ATPase, and a Fis-type DNA-binding domains [Allopseudospirillum japonicum]
MSHILIVEDESIIRSALRRLLERNGFRVSEAQSVEEALPLLQAQSLDLIISDLRLPGSPGTELIAAAQATPVLIMTSYASLRSAVDAMKLGAVDYIAKPFDHEEMLQAVNHILSQHPKERQAPVSARDEAANDLGMIGDCEPMQEVYRQLRKVAPVDTRVLILGESGTGKELVARALHQLSPRRDGPLICVNCAAIPETLIESELFGHEKGAFTGANASRNGLVEAADRGTLFLDEIGELPLEAQARLLRVLQEGEIRRLGSVESRKVDVRLIAATHRDLKGLTERGEFRLDLYYRLNVMEIHLPPLRDRGQDVLAIAERLLEDTCTRLARKGLRFSKAAREKLLAYTWPGNVRELENIIERAVILTEENLISAQEIHVVPDRQQAKPAINLKTSPPRFEEEEDNSEAPSDLSLEDYFQHFVLEHQDQMSETELARKLGISRKCLWERRQKLGIPRRRSSR